MPDIYVAPKRNKPATPTRTEHVAPAPRIRSHRHKRPSMLNSIFSSMISHPAGIRFETQEKDEEVIFLMRRHFVTNVPWILGTALLFVLPLFILPFLIATDALSSGVPTSFPVVLTLFWYVGAFGFFLMNFLHWYFNIYILTNRRVIDIDFVGLLYKQFSAAHLRSIEDITYKQGGFFSAFFNYGDVFIQTAGSEPNFEFTAVARPDELTRTISEYMRVSKRNH